jgi:hypothetical protein
MKEFQLPHSGQRPSHLAEQYPQLWHSKVEADLVIDLPKKTPRIPWIFTEHNQ